jgi:hypothetical protein
MTDTDKAQAEEQTQRVMPTQEEGKPDGVETEQAAPQKEVSESEESTSRDELPEGVTDRTREQFEKLKQSNQALKAELDKLSASQQKSVLGSLAPGQGHQAGPQQFVDPYTGEVDVAALNLAVANAQQQAIAAREEARRVKEQSQEKEAYADYPELNPNAKGFDKELFRKTRAVLLDSMMNPADYGNRELSLKEAADLASGGQSATKTKQAEDNARQALEQLTPKEQASLEAEGRSDRRQNTASAEDLQERSRRGDNIAIMERLKNIK